MNISPVFRPDGYDAEVAAELLKFEGTGSAVVRFSELADGLSDYAYWFILGTLWVSYSGGSDLDLWKRLFASPRRLRKVSLMKPDEYRAFKALPAKMTVFRAHREGETDWISYSLDPAAAAQFAVQRGAESIRAYRIYKRDVVALFLRRGESEVLVIDSARACQVCDIDVVMSDAAGNPIAA